MFQALILLLFVSFKSISTFSTGAATTACEHMTPGHAGILPQSSAAPITIAMSTETLEQGQSMQLTLQADDDFSFKGFMVQARSLTVIPQVVGRFHFRPGMRAVDCVDLPTSSVFTHVSSVPKTRVQLVWEAPSDFIGFITFQ